MFGKLNSDSSTSGKQPRLTRLTRPEIIGILNAIIDLYSDAPKIKGPPLPKTDANKLIQEPKEPASVSPPATATPRAPRVPDKLVLPKCKQRGDAMLDVLDTLRTYVKYGLFERDALRREVAYLKQMVEDLGGKI